MKYFDRYTRVLKIEKTPGESFLKFLYDTTLGYCLLHLFIKRAWVSYFIGWWMNTRFSKKKIQPFVEKYEIDLNLFKKPPEGYAHFNDFFYRKFKPGVRPICEGDQIVCFPAEGRHLGFQSITDTQTFFIKGMALNLMKLLGDVNLVRVFQYGPCIISRLAPVDYHRFHFPCSGVPQAPWLNNGYLYSVHPLALRRNMKIFGENKRWLTVMQSEQFGKVMLIEIGACCVGSVCETFQPNRFYRKGDEKGYFLFGGSTVITLFEANRVVLANDLLNCTRNGVELYAHVGDKMGQVIC